MNGLAASDFGSGNPTESHHRHEPPDPTSAPDEHRAWAERGQQELDDLFAEG